MILLHRLPRTSEVWNVSSGQTLKGQRSVGFAERFELNLERLDNLVEIWERIRSFMDLPHPIALDNGFNLNSNRVPITKINPCRDSASFGVFDETNTTLTIVLIVTESVCVIQWSL